MTASGVIEFAPAKINLTLEVIGRQRDGYHSLDSLVVFASDVGDRIEINPDGPSGITTIGPFAGSIAGENILARAVLALGRYGVSCGGICLDKQLPVASGIGGGSADAGALLRAARRIYPERADCVPWPQIAASLGADVTACLLNKTLRIVGTGTEVEPVPSLPILHAVLINPMVPVPGDKTARVFRTMGLQPAAIAPNPISPLPTFGASQALIAFIARSRNGLTKAAAEVVPAITDVLRALDAIPGCRVARLSGAGPTCFGLFDDSQAASLAAETIRGAHPYWWVKATRLS